MKALEVEELIHSYHNWLKEKTRIKELSGWVEVTTPFLDQDNDYIQIYLNKDSSGITIKDDGFAINELRLMGCEVSRGKRKELLEYVLNGFGVSLKGDALMATATEANFPVKKHNFIQAVLAVLDLFYTSRTNVKTFFLEDVSNWLIENQIRFIQNVRFPGKTGYDFLFHFAIPPFGDAPERILQAMSRPDPTHTKNLILAWMDTKEMRPAGSKAYVLLNDMDFEVARQETDALESYDIKAARWSQRDSIRDELAA